MVNNIDFVIVSNLMIFFYTKLNNFFENCLRTKKWTFNFHLFAVCVTIDFRYLFVLSGKIGRNYSFRYYTRFQKELSIYSLIAKKWCNTVYWYRSLERIVWINLLKLTRYHLIQIVIKFINCLLWRFRALAFLNLTHSSLK